MKLNSPLSISLFTGFLVSIVVFVTSIIISKYNYETYEFIRAGLSGLISGVLGFVVFRITIKIYIQRKIKLINRIIRQSKIKKNPVVDMRKDVLHEVTRDVKEWADQKKERIKELEVQEGYRKQFVGNISHELRTPIFNIQGYILTLLEGGLDDENVNRKYLEKAEKSVDRMISIVEDLNFITQYEEGSNGLMLKKTNALEVVANAIESVEKKATENGITIRYKKDYGDGVLVFCDANKIERALINLFINSIKYSTDNGFVEVRFYDMDERILVEIADNGIGIAEHHLPRLFERFYRVEESRSRDKGGTGLGLAIVKHIIDAHNESINVRSTLNEGTTISFTLKKV